KEHAWKVCKRLIPASRVRIPLSPPDFLKFNGGPVGSLATIVCKSRQGRKAATVVNDSGAGKELTGLATSFASNSSGHSMGESSSEFAAYVAEQLRPLGALAIDRFFGGLSIKSGAALFAMIMDGALYFAVDDELRAEYERLGSHCFSYDSKKGRVD